MSSFSQAQRLFEQGREREAVAFVEQAAERGDTEAQLALAHWRLFARYVPRDLSEAHRLLERAGASGSVEAERLRATLIGNGTGCSSDPNRARGLFQKIASSDRFADFQLKFVSLMMPLERVPALERRTLSDDPPVFMVEGLLLREECQYLMKLAEPRLQPSFVIDPATGRQVPHPVRTSAGTNFGPLDEDLIVHAINRRIAAATATEVAWGEPLHILRYAPGEEYKPHVDALPGVKNQRHWTALVYLNDGYGGGETQFPKLGVTAKGKQGDALVFRNVKANGRGDPRTIHAGLPVTSGVKWLATRWIRQAPHDPFEGLGQS